MEFTRVEVFTAKLSSGWTKETWRAHTLRCLPNPPVKYECVKGLLSLSLLRLRLLTWLRAHTQTCTLRCSVLHYDSRARFFKKWTSFGFSTNSFVRSCMFCRGECKLHTNTTLRFYIIIYPNFGISSLIARLRGTLLCDSWSLTTTSCWCIILCT